MAVDASYALGHGGAPAGTPVGELFNGRESITYEKIDAQTLENIWNS